MIFTATAARVLSSDVHNGSRALPAFYIEGADPFECAARIAELLTLGNRDMVGVAMRNTATDEVYVFTASGGKAAAMRLRTG